VHVSYHRLTRADIESGQGSPIGVAIPDLQLYLLDERRQPVPIGVAGEIYVGGDGLARGYLNRPELTQERFIAHPYGGQPGARLYRSGDLARWRADGTLEYLGRNDQQLKLRGFRIEPGEIEVQLLRQPGIREAAVLLREDQPGDQRLVAYLTLQAGKKGDGDDGGEVGSDVDASALRMALKAVLPEYMLPAAYVVLPHLPLTAHGKLARQALPAPEYGNSVTRQYVAPEGEIEETIAAVWQELLQPGATLKVGRHDNFFDLGGHSLLLIKVKQKLEAHLSVSIAIVDLFRYTTVASLAKFLSQGNNTGHASLQRHRDRAQRQRGAFIQRKQKIERIH